MAKQRHLPPLRALQAFESFGRLGSVSAAAKELGVTPGAISQQIKILENQLDLPLIMKDGRRASLAPKATSYHELISIGFEKLRQAQHFLSRQKSDVDVQVSGLPTFLLKWLNPRLHRFQASYGEAAIRLDATHVEPDPQFLDHGFRLTYGAASEAYGYARALFRDVCFPVCSPDFLMKYPQALGLKNMESLPWIDIDWAPVYGSVPHLTDWLSVHSPAGVLQKPVTVHSLSSSALEAAIGGQGITLAQSSFAGFDLDSGRLVKLSDHSIELPESYFTCWEALALEDKKSRDFLNWVLAEARAQ